MFLWKKWFNCVSKLKDACKNYRTYFWLIVILASFSIRDDLAGVTSFVRCLGLHENCYYLLLHFFHSKAISLNSLRILWVETCFSIFSNSIQKMEGYALIIADAIKVSKEGKKMPAVKSLHQESDSNTKPEYIMGHYFECFSLLVGKLGHFFAVPLFSGLHGGVIFNKKDSNITLIDMFIEVLEKFMSKQCIIVADAYYAARKIMIYLVGCGSHLITRMRTNSIAWEKTEEIKNKKGRGRPKKYGRKVILRNLFERIDLFKICLSPVYGEEKIKIKYLVKDYILRPFCINVRIVLVLHPSRGKIILLSTNQNMTGIQIIETYGFRFKIEVGFKQAVHTLGSYAYHFWMSMMEKIKIGSGDQQVYKKNEKYQQSVKRKLNAYGLYVQLGLIAQGLLIYLSITYTGKVWRSFKSWFRTMNKKNPPSELAVTHSLKSTFWEFLYDLPKDNNWKKFLIKYLDFSRLPGLRNIA